MPQKSIILYASGSPIIVDFEEVCLKNNIKVKAIIKNQINNPCYATFKDKVINLSQLSTLEISDPFLCTLFSPHNRYSAVKEAVKNGLQPFNLLSDKYNDLPFNFIHGKGCFINKRVVIGAQSQIGNYVSINRGAVLGHHLFLDDFVSIGPGVVSGGSVTIKYGTSIGTGAVILPERTIGQHVIVGAGAIVTKDIEDYSIVVGNPARVIKQNKNIF